MVELKPKGKKNESRARLYIEAIAVFVILALFLFILAQRINSAAKENIENRVACDLGVSAKLISSKIEGFICCIREKLIYSATQSEIRYPDEQKSVPKMKELFESLADKVGGVTWMDTLGVIALTWPDTHVIGQSIAFQKHVKKTRATRKPVISAPVLSVQGYKAIIIHEPVFEDDSVWLGNICALVPFENIESELLADVAKIDAKAFIVDSSGEFLYHPELAPGTKISRAFPAKSSEVLTEMLGKTPSLVSGHGIFIDHTGKRKILGVAPICIGENVWTIGVYRGTEGISAQMATFRKELYFAFFCVLLIAAIGIIVLTSYSLRKENMRGATDESVLKLGENRLRLLHEGFHALVSSANEREALGIIIDNTRIAGDFDFVCSLKIDDNERTFSLATVSYREPSRREEFLEELGKDVFSLKFPYKPEHPVISALAGGEHLSLISPEQVASFSQSLAEIVGCLLDFFKVPRLDVFPLRAKGELLGALVTIGGNLEVASPKTIEPFTDQGAEVLHIARILRKLRQANALYNDVFQYVDYGIFLVDANLKLLSFNRVMEQFYGLSTEDIGKQLTEVLPYINKFGHESNYTNVFRTGRSITTQETSFIRETERRFVRTKLVPIFGAGEGVQRVMTIIEDITEQRELAEELRETMRELEVQASTDGLTGLYNYRYFSEALPKAIEMARNAGAPLSLVVLDLDNLKEYNDLGGHHYGDNLLRVVAEILKEHESPGDTIARYGGDEFVMILRNTDLTRAENRAELVRSNIVAYPFQDEEHLTGGNVTASFGIAELTAEVADADDLMRRADRALYRAKEEGKNRVCIWENRY
ncbi:hypothetical protein DRQ36_02590 [bacterium]|nr:MAG: hypothetical protein DRQ36_02590 [bacterium]